MIRTGLIWSSLALVVMAGIVIWAWGAMPTEGQIPVHWNAAGVADGFSSPAEARRQLLILPGAAIFTAFILSIGPLIDPLGPNIFKSRTAYLAMWAAVMMLLVFITGMIALFMLAGVIGIISTLFLGGASLILAMAGPVSIAGLVSVVYSYFAWRKAPDRRRTPDYIS